MTGNFMLKFRLFFRNSIVHLLLIHLANKQKMPTKRTRSNKRVTGSVFSMQVTVNQFDVTGKLSTFESWNSKSLILFYQNEALKSSKKAESAGHTLCPFPLGDKDKLQFCNLIVWIHLLIVSRHILKDASPSVPPWPFKYTSRNIRGINRSHGHACSSTAKDN